VQEENNMEESATGERESTNNKYRIASGRERNNG